eukprot:CAMPEP_0172540402 /NCGR_PEP_ID=MMETSP1067-20121228/11429_1 /TAXON_ID=265564 ORGANISM="Thalassiosira punctigera, Strain Tpunct2005C2" /NCGR_SAMPLE_ID=MMETSP1067 /ASSEMBLY_ACC=CAM_ASM_000444 /LENGTH=478 /DNA_ID=CAMNT_0013326261 /DNA_START=113 /DNA_END=1549 /DNA_ORIENTATION=+
MGCVASKKAPFAEGSGTESEYKSAFDEKIQLGQGEFGVVKLVVKRNAPTADHFAVKVLNKGFAFKDNVLYTPMKPEELRMEIDILRALGGKAYNLRLDSVYESSSKLYLVTEICAGGEMLEYTSKNMAEGLRTEEVSRISYQLLSAVDHCDRHNVLHRDIKPENIMFKANTRTAELRLIDFGCATIDSDEDRGKEHSTFAGTPFYISPEMFQKIYTSKTDVFSAGVVLYVLVAGYPAAQLQAAFNILHKANRNLKTLPGMPEDMPQTYYDMLDKMLVYRYKGRKSAGDMLDDEFASFHKALEDEGQKTQSVLLPGTGDKAAISFGFMKFQRILTFILATMLPREDLLTLLSFVEAKVSSDAEMDSKLGVIEVKDVKLILDTMGKSDVVSAIEKQKNSGAYDGYSYDYPVLRPFTNKREGGALGGNDGDDPDSSTRSAKLNWSGRGKSQRAAAFQNSMSSSERIPRKKRGMTKAQSVYL